VKKVYISVNSHFDLMWRRPFNQNFVVNGENYVSYADIEAYYIIDNINHAKKYDFYKFQIESVAVLRNFLDHYPQYMEDLKALFAAGRVDVPWCGDNIVDGNMTHGESIVRNYLYGKKYLEETFGYTPKHCDRADAFGNSAQFPQIVKKFGMDMVYNITYSPCEGNYWRGLDGTIVACGHAPKSVATIGAYHKYAPCPVCKGFKDENCEHCHGRGIDTDSIEPYRTHVNNDNIKYEQEPQMIRVWGEEALPTEESINWYLENKDQYDVEYKTEVNCVDEASQDVLAGLVNPPENEIHPSAEANPNNTGCYVTRIRVKQKLRKCEHDMFTLEALLASVDKSFYEKYEKELLDIWSMLHFVMFHDALPGTHVDAAYTELMEVFSDIETKITEISNHVKEAINTKEGHVISVYNPLSYMITKPVRIEIDTDQDIVLKQNEKVIPYLSYEKMDGKVRVEFIARDIPAFSSAVYEICEEKPVLAEIVSEEITTVIEAVSEKIEERGNDAGVSGDLEKVYAEISNEYYQIKADRTGVVSIFDKKLNKPISTPGEFRPFEIIMEHDEGSPWATLSDDMRRIPCSRWTSLDKIEKCSEFERLTFKVRPGDVATYSVVGMYGKYTITLYKTLPSVSLSLDMYWDTYNQRIRVAVPSDIIGKSIYEIPFGMIEREAYEAKVTWPGDTSNWSGAAGDWPAINWAGISNENESIALINNGTPSYQISKDNTGKMTIFVTPLRSPAIPTYLHDPQTYSMLEFDGMRDAGNHHFEYLLTSYNSGFDTCDVVKDGITFNRELYATLGNIKTNTLPAFVSDSLILTNVKVSEDKTGIIYRVVDMQGKGGEGTIQLTQAKAAVYECDLNETAIAEITVCDNKANIKAKPFEIKTYKIIL